MNVKRLLLAPLPNRYLDACNDLMTNNLLDQISKHRALLLSTTTYAALSSALQKRRAKGPTHARPTTIRAALTDSTRDVVAFLFELFRLFS